MSKAIFAPEYMVAIPSLAQPMAFFGLMLCVFISSVLAWIWFKRRHWYYQPSLIMFAVLHVLIQWPSLLFVDWATEHLVYPWKFFVLVHGFAASYVIVVIPISLLRDSSLRKFHRGLCDQMNGPNAWPTGIMYLSLPVAVAVLCLFLTHLPFRQTALYAFFMDPTQIGVARTIGLREMDSRTLAYLFSWNVNTFGPFLVFGACYFFWNRKSPKRGPLVAVFLLVGFLAMSVSGQRAGPTYAALLSFIAFLCARRRKPSIAMFAIIAILVLSIPALISIRREGRDWSWSKQAEYVQTILFSRILTTPTQTGMLYIYDAEANGLSGAAGFRPLAVLMGVEFETLPYRIGKEYSTYSEHSFTNTNALFEYYKIMGLFAIPFTVIGLLCFDFFLIFFHFPSVARLPFVIFFVCKAMAFAGSTLTVILVTEGFWMLPGIAFLCRLPPPQSLGKLEVRSRSLLGRQHR